MSEISLKPIGYVRTRFSDEDVRKSWPKGVEAEIEVLPQYEDAMKGLDGFSHIVVIFYMHKISEKDRATLLVKPRRLTRLGISLDELPLVGVFALDSPLRPNPIGLTIARVLSISGRIIRVDGMDAYDGTPVLDIKPYTPDRAVAEIELPSWYRSLWERIGRRPL